MGVSILRNILNLYNSLYFNKLQAFRSFGDMLIGSEIPPQVVDPLIPLGQLGHKGWPVVYLKVIYLNKFKISIIALLDIRI